ncbi:hypothetical protein A2U01_0081224, partial [Trifolium medium]|nr:hypothetical protein [Trifolium medium]
MGLRSSPSEGPAHLASCQKQHRAVLVLFLGRRPFWMFQSTLLKS